ncbi:hypothetical protein BB560_004613 [Smittium megazygosporum]|uniref:Sas10 C-terminal domain-containing protein n=1 Tax=Smittium megazygosporum TaxID=133381 RepID=A0A2T9Z8R0_9FUNG|nr:hypothetical protein BB560_004613 [Smittium megazygosporum]
MSMDKINSHLVQMKTQAIELAPIINKITSSLITVKFFTLLEYIADLTCLSISKLQPENKLDSIIIIERLIENRLILEKIKPIEQRLKYQIDSLVRVALTNSQESNNEPSSKNAVISEQFLDDSMDNPTLLESEDLSYKPKLQSLMASAKASGLLPSDLSSSKDGLPGSKDFAQKSDVYVPPKLMPVHFDEDSSLKKRREKAEQRLKERSARSEIIKDLVSEYDNRPEAVSSWGTNSTVGVAATDKLESARQERARYEEDHFIRMTTSKKQKNLYRQGYRNLANEFSSLSNFAAINQLQAANSSSAAKNKRVLDKRGAQSEVTPTFSKKRRSGKFQARKKR